MSGRRTQTVGYDQWVAQVVAAFRRATLEPPPRRKLWGLYQRNQRPATVLADAIHRILSQQRKPR